MHEFAECGTVGPHETRMGGRTSFLQRCCMAVGLKLHIRLPNPPDGQIWTCLIALVSVATVIASLSARADPKDTPSTVDLELVLAVDVSGSMNQDEQRVQREGYVHALRNPDVLRAIRSGTYGRIAIAYVEWASPDDQRVLLPLTVIKGPDEAAAFADLLEAQPILAGGGTSISSGLLSAGRLLQTSSLHSDRQIIDVSGDGPNNAGPPVAQVRDAMVARSATINGLAISKFRHDVPDMPNSFGEGSVGWYYEGCVIGGPGAFVIAVSDLADFEKAIRRKLVLEIAGLPSRLQLAAYDAHFPPRADCLTIGQSPGR
jgi:hypothetical protein